MSTLSPMSRIPVAAAARREGRGHQRTISAPSKLELMQKAIRDRIEQEKQEKLLRLQEETRDRLNGQIHKHTASSHVANGSAGGGVRRFLKERREAGSGRGVNVARKPPLPYQKNSAGRDRAHPLAPLQDRPQVTQDWDVGVLGGHGSPTSLQHSPKPRPPRLRAKQRARRGVDTPTDSGNESSGLEENGFEHRSNNSGPASHRRRLLPASSEESLNSIGRKTNRFGHHKQSSRNTAVSDKVHSGYHSDGPVSDFRKWQAEQDKDRAQRLQRYAESKRTEGGGGGGHGPHSPASPAPNHQDLGARGQFVPRPPPQDKPRVKRKPPQTKRERPSERGMEEDYPASQASTSRSHVSRGPPSGRDKEAADLQEELKRKEKELVAMIQKQQQELQMMQDMREEEQEEDRKQRQAQQERQRAQQAEQEEQRARERQRQRQDQEARRPIRAEEGHHPTTPPSGRSFPRKAAPAARRLRATKKKPPPPPPRPLPQPGEEEPFYDTTGAADYYKELAEGADAAPVQIDLVPCAQCGRKFAADRLTKHRVACQKAQAAASKRKVFDPVKMRTQGTEQAQYVTDSPTKPEKKKKSDWRQKREDFIQALRYAKQVTAVEKQGGNVASLPPPPVTQNTHYKQCPYCERRFAPETAERHIPRCKDIKSRPRPPAKRRGR